MTSSTGAPTADSSVQLQLSTPNRISALFAACLCLVGVLGGLAWFGYLTIHPRHDPNLASRYFGIYAAAVGLGLLLYTSRFVYRVRITSTELVPYRLFSGRKQALRLDKLSSVYTETRTMARTSVVDYVLVLGDSTGAKVKLDMNMFSRRSRTLAYPYLYQAISKVDFTVDKQFVQAWESWFYFVEGRNDQFARKFQLDSSATDE